jgi:hypothetical protein
MRSIWSGWEDDGLGLVHGVDDRRRGHAPTQLVGDAGWHATRRDHHRLFGLAEQAGERLAGVAGADYRCRRGLLLLWVPTIRFAFDRGGAALA